MEASVEPRMASGCSLEVNPRLTEPLWRAQGLTCLTHAWIQVKQETHPFLCVCHVLLCPSRDASPGELALDLVLHQQDPWSLLFLFRSGLSTDNVLFYLAPVTFSTVKFSFRLWETQVMS